MDTCNIQEMKDLEAALCADKRNANIIAAIRRAIEAAPFKSTPVWYDSYIPLFLLCSSQGDSTQLERMTTFLEQEMFNRFYSDLHDAFAKITDAKTRAKLTSKDERYIKAFMAMNKERKRESAKAH